MLFPYFVYIVHFTKFTRGISLEKSLLVEKSSLVEKSKVEGKKKKNKKESTILSRKEKKRKSFEKATGTSGAPRWHPDFEQRSRRQTKNCYT